jgi:hypothetical protein
LTYILSRLTFKRDVKVTTVGQKPSRSIKDSKVYDDLRHGNNLQHSIMTLYIATLDGRLHDLMILKVLIAL